VGAAPRLLGARRVVVPATRRPTLRLTLRGLPSRLHVLSPLRRPRRPCSEPLRREQLPDLRGCVPLSFPLFRLSAFPHFRILTHCAFPLGGPDPAQRSLVGRHRGSKGLRARLRRHRAEDLVKRARGVVGVRAREAERRLDLENLRPVPAAEGPSHLIRGRLTLLGAVSRIIRGRLTHH